MTDPAQSNGGGAVADTLEKPDLHKEWISNYRTDAVNSFTAGLLQRAIERLSLPAGAKVLDAGCGSGTNSLWLARQGFGVTGVDFSDFALEKAHDAAAEQRLADSIDFRRADLTSLPFDDGSFDAVFCIGVLMHIPEVEKAVAELARVVRPGGALVISETNAHALETYAFRLYWKLWGRNMRVGRKPSGIEVWSQTPAGPLLSRKMSIGWLTGFLAQRGLARVLRTTGELTELYVYFGSSAVRKLFHSLNRLWLKLHGPSSLAIGNLVAFRKAAEPQAGNR